jgi:hypothetical protein
LLPRLAPEPRRASHGGRGQRQIQPEDVPLPEIAWAPEGSISLDWIQSHLCVFSVR